MKRWSFNPCKERDCRSAAMKRTHQIIKKMDDEGIPTIGKFGKIYAEELQKFRLVGFAMVDKGKYYDITYERFVVEANKLWRKKRRGK